MKQERLLQGVLYGGAPFFAYPWKPLLNALVGSSYSVAYSHFRRDHKYATNLAAHLLCLVWQLGSNYALLDHIDDWIEKHKPYLNKMMQHLHSDVGGLVDSLPPIQAIPDRMFAKLTTAAWTISLATAPGCPIVVKMASISCLGAAYSSRRALHKYWESMIYAQGILESVAFQLLFQRQSIWNRSMIQKLVFRGALQWVVMKHGKGLFAVLTNQPLLYFYSGGYIASLGQGVSHALTGELATLAQLQAEGSE
eukprot:gene1421-15843_t